MLLPRVVVAALAARQLDGIIPSDYCQPQCPSCKDNVANFNLTTSCVADSPFITNCGACQQCIITYSIDHQVPNLNFLELDLKNFLNWCENTTVSTQISGLQSQASRLSVLASSVTFSATTTGTANLVITTAPTPTSTSSNVGCDNAHLSSLLVTASWSSKYAAGKSTRTGSWGACTASAAAESPSDSTPSAASLTATSSTKPTTTPQPGPGPALNQTWIAGPVVGSILGMATVFVVIYCTRRKQRREEWELGGALPPKELPKEDDEESNDSHGKPQLHSDCVPLKEMPNTEVAAPVELPALEPVGMELLTPRDETESPEKEWPLPISPLPALFAMTEIRDERTGTDESPRHETFYHP